MHCERLRERPDQTVFRSCGSTRCRIERRRPPLRAARSMTGTGRFHRDSAHYSGVERRRYGQKAGGSRSQQSSPARRMVKIHIFRAWSPVSILRGTSDRTASLASAESFPSALWTDRSERSSKHKASRRSPRTANRGHGAPGFDCKDSSESAGCRLRSHRESQNGSRIRRRRICRLRLAPASGISALTELWPSG